MGENFAARASAVTAASVRPTPEPPTIRSRSHAPSSSAAAIDPASRPAAVKQTVSAPAACALSAIRSAVTAAAGHIDDAQPRTADVQSLQSGGARQQEIARQHAPPGLRDETAGGNIAARPAHALPRNRLRQHLRHRPGQIDGIGIEHAVASRRGWPRRPRPRPAAPTTATANRRMRRRDRAREKRSHPPRRCRAADRQEAAASRRRCNAALP